MQLIFTFIAGVIDGVIASSQTWESEILAICVTVLEAACREVITLGRDNGVGSQSARLVPL